MKEAKVREIAPAFVSIEFAQDYLGGVSRTVFREMLTREEIESRYVGRRRMVVWASLESYASTRSKSAPPRAD